ncbi:MAG: hypothetical protein JSS76_08395 [Bacteroidetes bacterium]|nr:hypothetical protein [Bacteroidota bacterium]
MIKRAFTFLRLWDGFWSVPLSFLTFLAVEVVGHFAFGDGWAAYDPAILQAVVLAGFIMVAINMAVQFAIWFNFPAIWGHYHVTFVESFSRLAPWQKVLFTVFLYCFYFILFVAVVLRVI